MLVAGELGSECPGYALCSTLPYPRGPSCGTTIISFHTAMFASVYQGRARREQTPRLAVGLRQAEILKVPYLDSAVPPGSCTLKKPGAEPFRVNIKSNTCKTRKEIARRTSARV